MKRIPWLLPIVLLAACSYPPTPPPGEMVIPDNPPPGSMVIADNPLPGSMVMTEPIFMELVRVPADEFLMGSDPVKDSEAEYYLREQPQHRVTLPEFYIGRYEVTNDQYAAFVKATGHIAPDNRALGYAFDRLSIDGPYAGMKPVVGVSWHDATAFAGWLSEETGIGFRLCTEAEWEKACRGTDGLIYPWGDTFDEAKARAQCSLFGCLPNMRAVGSYSPAGDSPYGAADMSGNADEWTSSLWGKEGSREFPYPYDPNDGRENQSAPDDVGRVVRGRDGNDGPNRCAQRYYAEPQDSSRGFRVCVSPVP